MPKDRLIKLGIDRFNLTISALPDSLQAREFLNRFLPKSSLKR
jgi:hypothetical protein